MSPFQGRCLLSGRDTLYNGLIGLPALSPPAALLRGLYCVPLLATDLDFDRIRFVRSLFFCFFLVPTLNLFSRLGAEGLSPLVFWAKAGAARKRNSTTIANPSKVVEKSGVYRANVFKE